jgi:Nickel responsive protein SCO4226-like
MKKYIIEREMPGVGALMREQLRAAAERSDCVLAELGPGIQWVESFVTENKIYCIYLAQDEAIVRRHADMSGFPANKITEVKCMLDLKSTARLAMGIP